MQSFEELFPDFLASCDKLHGHLVPVSLALLVLSFGFFFWSGPQQPFDLIKFVAKLFLIVLLITHADRWIDQAQDWIDGFIHKNVDARPDNIATLYQQKLATAQNDPSVANQGWWDWLKSLFSSTFFEAIIYALLLLVSWLAMAIQFFISILQNVVLKICWVLSPILFACFAIPALSSLAFSHVLRIMGVLLWPMGLALAATITAGLIGMQTDQIFFANPTAENTACYYLVNLLAVAVIGLWILFTSFLAPAAMQRLVTGSTGSAGVISRAGQLLANNGPAGMALRGGQLLVSAPFLLLGSIFARAFPSRASRRNDDAPPSLINPEAAPNPPMEPSVPPKTHADDPTAEQAVKEVLDK